DPDVLCKVRILQAYIDVNQEDELKVLENDVVAVSKNNFDEDPNDWLYGTNLRTKLSGFFPTNICDIRLPDKGNIFIPRKSTINKRPTEFKPNFKADAKLLASGYWMEAVAEYKSSFIDESDIYIKDLFW
ncbi:MAG: hypothetical protein MHPSP_001849, partial [Paramarteilia canceri]